VDILDDMGVSKLSAKVFFLKVIHALIYKLLQKIMNKKGSKGCNQLGTL